MFQQTIQQSITCTGIGVHSGRKTELTLRPAPVHAGIIFQRTDVPNNNEIPATWGNVSDTNHCTRISNEYGVSISTIEHLMSALFALGIDNIMVEVNGPELPIMDGSAEPFLKMIAATGVKSQEAPRSVLRVLRPIQVHNDGISATLSPSEEFSISFHYDFQGRENLKAQSLNFNFSKGDFKNYIAGARTFGFYDQVEALQKAGLARGGSLENAVVIKDGEILNEDGLRFDDEFVRHKILDVIGDLYLAGMPILGHFEGNSSGHHFNYLILKELFSSQDNFEIMTPHLNEEKQGRFRTFATAIESPSSPVFA